MPPEVLILFFGSLFGIGGIILLGQWLRYKQLQSGSAPEEMDRILEAIESLRQEVGRLDDSVQALDERVDFAERLLSEPRDPQLPRGRDPAPGSSDREP